MAVMTKKMEARMREALLKEVSKAWIQVQPRMSGKSSMSSGTHIHSVMPSWKLSVEDPDDVTTKGSPGWYWKWGWDDASKGHKSALTEVTFDHPSKSDAYQQGYNDGLDYVAVREQLENGVADRT